MRSASLSLWAKGVRCSCRTVSAALRDILARIDPSRASSDRVIGISRCPLELVSFAMGSDSLGGEEEVAKIDCEISIYIYILQ